MSYAHLWRYYVSNFDYDKYLRKNKTQWCSGCGDGIVLQAMVQSVDIMITQNNWIRENVVIVSGIGCSGRISSYFDGFTLHTTHGRPLAYASGIKAANQKLHVIVVSGDGDCGAIGGNHFIHGCRRNIDITYIVINNFIYGLTNSQASPTTPAGDWAVTAQDGVIEHSFDLCTLAMGAGATFVAREPARMTKLKNTITKALLHKGISFVEVFSECPVNFGRKNKMGSPIVMHEWIDTISIPSRKFKKLETVEQEGKFPTGILYEDKKKSEYCANYEKKRQEIAERENTSITKKKVYEIDYKGTSLRRQQIRFLAIGGQGMISAGKILNHAVNNGHGFAVETGTYTSQVRGGPTVMDVVVDPKDEIFFPYAISGEIDLVIAVANLSYQKFKNDTRHGSVIVVDPNLVHVSAEDREKWNIIEIPIVQIANEEVGNVITQSVIALAIAVVLTGCVSEEGALHTVLSRVSADYREINKKAFAIGIEYADKALVKLRSKN